MIQAAVANMSAEEQAKEIKQMKPTVRVRVCVWIKAWVLRGPGL